MHIFCVILHVQVGKEFFEMAETTNLSIRIDKDLKEQADKVFNDMGMNMTTAFNIFIRQTLWQGKIPFEIYTNPFYTPANMKVLEKSKQEATEGKFVSKTIEELRAMEE